MQLRSRTTQFGDPHTHAASAATDNPHSQQCARALIYGPAPTGPWKTVEDVELATVGWVYWHNISRLLGHLDDVPPTEFEATFYATNRTDQTLVEIQ